MDPSPPPSHDPYSRVDYRSMIAWGPRIAREAPLLLRLLDEAPERSVVDLGCGTGEHVAFFADRGARAVGIDSSETMVERAREHEVAGRGRFVHGEVAEARRLLGREPAFGMAVCLGNVLPHLTEQPALEAFLAGGVDVLLPGGILLVQVLNYERILSQGVRHMPLNFRKTEDGKEVVYLRLFQPAGEGRMWVYPVTLELDPGAQEPARVAQSRCVPVRAWRRDDLVPALDRLGFDVRVFGDVLGGAFDPAASPDLVLEARKFAPRVPASRGA